MPTINFGDLNKSVTEKPDPEKRATELWQFMTKNLLEPLTAGETEPYLTKVAKAKADFNSKITLSEFATAHNLKKDKYGKPSEKAYGKAFK
jgi:hypothetical protein